MFLLSEEAYRLLGREVNLEGRAALQEVLFGELPLLATSSTSHGPSASTAELMKLQATDPHAMLHQLFVYRGAVDERIPVWRGSCVRRDICVWDAAIGAMRFQ